MKIIEIKENKKRFKDILLIGDEQENMIEKYLEKGILFALYDNNALKAVCVILKINSETIEIKNIATYPNFRNKGYASSLIEYICAKYRTAVKYLILGTGENTKTLNFYKKRGFKKTHTIKNFFIENYNHPIFEDNTQLVDMIYLRREL